MVKKCVFIFFICLTKFLFGQQPNDCVGSITVCGNQDLPLEVNGAGIQDIPTSNACNFNGETNSIWLKVIIEEGGTLGFTITPNTSNLNVDNDFWVFGPNVTCGDLGPAIRCSTTNPLEANQGNNLTGMNGEETDISEGPGALGNSFVKWLTVFPDEVYYIVINRWSGNTNFNIEWIGSAQLLNPLEGVEINTPEDISLCDEMDDGLETFDFGTLNDLIVDPTPGITVSYFSNNSDAVIGNNALPLVGQISAGTYYARIENTNSKCFEIVSFDIALDGIPVLSPVVYYCDDLNDGSEMINLNDIEVVDPNLDVSISYYLNEDSANNGDSNQIQNPETFLLNAPLTIVYARVWESDDCFSVARIEINLEQNPVISDFSTQFCANDLQNNMLNLNDFIPDLGDPNLSYTFYQSIENFDNNQPIANPLNYAPLLGDNIIFVQAKSEHCFSNLAQLSITLFSNPDDYGDLTFELCPEELPFTLPEIPAGYNSYEWSNGETDVTTITVSEWGEYWVVYSNSEGCTEDRTYTVQQRPFPTITEVDVDNNYNVTIEFMGDTEDVQFSLDQGNWQSENYYANILPGEHQVIIKYTAGCESEPFHFIALIITNFISPNDDGLNDTWEFPGEYNFENTTVKIFDRYGKIIVNEKITQTLIWNGTYNGRKLPTGDYWYIVETPKGKKYSGHITLKNK